jgi:MYND finger
MASYYVRPTRLTARVMTREEREQWTDATPEEAADATTCSRCQRTVFGECVSVGVVVGIQLPRFALTLGIVCPECVRRQDAVCLRSTDAMRAALGRRLVEVTTTMWTQNADGDEFTERLFAQFDEERAVFLRALGDTHTVCNLCMRAYGEMTRCQGCHYATYCSAECEAAHFPNHVELCKALSEQSFFLE